MKNILSKIQNGFLLGIYRIKPKFFFYSFYSYFEKYTASPQITGLRFSKDTKVAKKGEIIYLPNDVQITWQLMRYGELSYPISKIIKKKLNNKKKYTFIDIGANVGLVTRQLFFENKNIENYICVEPAKMTFNCLAKNTSSLKNLSLHNIGLGRKNETKNIFIDNSNHGNASLEKTMMTLSKYKNYKVEKINVMSVKSFFNLIKKDTKGKKLIIKIDTQSLDELIISLIPDEIINNTVLLNYELTSVKGVKKQKISVKDFKSNISKFKKIWSEDINNINSDWLTQNYESSGSKENIETDIYLMK